MESIDCMQYGRIWVKKAASGKIIEKFELLGVVDGYAVIKEITPWGFKRRLLEASEIVENDRYVLWG